MTDNVVTALASTFLIGSSLFISSNKDTHKRLDGFEILHDPTKNL